MIEFSQVQAATRCLGYAVPLYGRFGIVRQRWGNWDTQLCVHGIILCGKSDFPDAENPQDKFEARYVMVSAFQDADFKELCNVIKKPDLYSQIQDAQGTGRGPGPGRDLQGHRGMGRRQDPVRGGQDPEGRRHSGRAGDERPGSLRVRALPAAGHGALDRRPALRRHPGPGRLQLPASCPRPPGSTTGIWRPVGADNVKIYHDLLGVPMSKIKEWYDKAYHLEGGVTDYV